MYLITDKFPAKIRRQLCAGLRPNRRELELKKNRTTREIENWHSGGQADWHYKYSTVLGYDSIRLGHKE